MSEPVVVHLEGVYPQWWFNCLGAMDIYNERLDWKQREDLLMQWFGSRYQAKINAERGRANITFPDQERYLECVLTWS